MDPTFHEFSSDWLAAKELGVEENTASHYRNELTNHLLPFFEDHHLSQITVEEVDRYRQSKVREAAEITAAAENGKTPDGRDRRQARPALPARRARRSQRGRSTCTSTCSRRSSRWRSTTDI